MPTDAVLNLLLPVVADARQSAADAAQAVAEATSTEGLRWAGLILLLPVLAALGCGLCAACKVRGRLPAWITVTALGLSSMLVVMLALTVETATNITLFPWLDLNWGSGDDARSLVANWGLYVDPLSLLWMLFVVPLGTLIALYASEYMEDDLPLKNGKGYARFFAGVSIFLFAMSCLVLGDNLLMLYLGWEGVGLASYLLIGYYYKRPAAVAAAKKAFIMNRIGDLGLALGIMLIWLNFGSLSYDALFTALADSSGDEAIGGWSVQAIPYLLMLAAFGKSAQFPLYVWLPDAMEGPTPVSALIHAATMVTAGIYLIARMYPFFLLHDLALPTVAWIGGLTALLAATIGMAQYDIKRIMAYSTVSQLGYMFMGLGVMTSFGAVYHVFTHAFFKAVLFLTCGAIMHGFAGQLDLRKISGLRHMTGWKVVAWTMLIGCLCLAGFPGTSGFFSKDTILAEAFVTSGPGFKLLGFVGILTAGITAYYCFRVWFRVCAGPEQYEPGAEQHGAGDDHGGAHGHGHFHPHPPGLRINFVLLLLAAGALLAALPYFMPAYGDGAIQRMVAESSAAAGVPGHAHHPDGQYGEAAHGTFFGFDPHKAMYFVSAFVGLIGIAIAWYLHLANRAAADRLRATLLAGPFAWLPKAMENKWYVDEVYNALIVRPLWLIGHIMSVFDRHVLDGIGVDGTARLPRALGRLFQPLQNGLLQGYAVTMAGGVALIIGWVVWVWLRGGAS